MRIIGVIPVRWGSTRFPGKPLVRIAGKPMIRRVYEGAKAAKSLSRVVIATDDELIAKAAMSFKAPVTMTSLDCRSGMERCAEVAARAHAGIVVNIQGDEPLISGHDIDSLVAAFDDPDVQIASLAGPTAPEMLSDRNIVKVLIDRKGDAIAFARSALTNWYGQHYRRHIGIYAYRRKVLVELAGLEPGPREKMQSLEQYRAIENGYKIRIIETDSELVSVDVPGDVARVERLVV